VQDTLQIDWLTPPYGIDPTRHYIECNGQLQGMSRGWADRYGSTLAGQEIDITGLPLGCYILRITVNPPFTPQGGEPCPALDPEGFCHMFQESDYGNNVGEALVTIPSVRPGKNGFGPGGGQPAKDEMIDDENRPTK
jgi:hypothetical protein